MLRKVTFGMCALTVTFATGSSASAQQCSDVGANLSYVTGNIVNCGLGLGTITRQRARQVNAYTLPDFVIYQSNTLCYEGDGACYGIADTPLFTCEPTFSGPLGANTASAHRMKMISSNKGIILATPIPGSPPVPGCTNAGTGEFFNQPIPFANCPDPPDDPDGCEECERPSPILISIRGNRLELTDWANGVEFDLDADGFPEQISWTQGGADDAFLVLDRNANGIIDDGTELFGNFTPQPPSTEPNGFLALAVYDLPSNGGNGDGWISGADDIFADLGLWIDLNHDGQSQAVEVRSATSGGLQAIHLDYQTSRRTDRYGNAFRYHSTVRIEGHSGVRTKRAIDVFFLGGPAE